MKELEQSKMIYENIEIPAELDMVVKNAIAAAEEKRKREKSASGEMVNLQEEKRNKNNRKKIYTFVRYTMTTAAAIVIAFGIGLNSSESFAMEMESHPFLGPIAKVLTIRSYHGFDEAKGIEKDIEVPQIELGELGQAAGGAVESINVDIQRIVDNHLLQAEKDFATYQKDFLENGGSEEELAQRTMDLDVEYEVTYQDENKLSLVLYYYEASTSAYEKAYYYNVNLKDNQEISLQDLLGEGYASLVNEQIITQMKARMEADESVYYWGVYGKEEEGIEGFTGVDENTTFYLNAKGNPVITFPEYEVAPGYMGIQEFEITIK